MSISTSLSAALSGLAAATRGAEIVASNIANAGTEGYGRREIGLAARSLGGTGQGVNVTATKRIIDLALLNDRRIAQAGAGGAEIRAGFLSRMEQTIGLPGDAGALGTRIGALESALIAATARPDSEARLSAVLTEAKGIANHLVGATATVQEARSRADSDIASQVGLLNTTLGQVADLNGQIRRLQGGGRDASALLDQRQQLVDRIASIVPLREVPRDFGQVALVTSGGATLLDGQPSVFGFAPAGMIVPERTLASGGLSGLTLNGKAVQPDAALGGGALAANFALRDADGPAAQARLDALARDLVARFADPAVDPTLAPGAAGLFTDAGAAFDPVSETGLAGRLAVNTAVDPDAGGALWRLRDGIGAAVQGPVGASGLLDALTRTLTDPREPASGAFMPGPRGFATLAGDLLSIVASERLAAEQEAGYAGAKAETLRQLEREDGVDTDHELQKLLMIERAYGANARVIQTIDRMLDDLMRI